MQASPTTLIRLSPLRLGRLLTAGSAVGAGVAGVLMASSRGLDAAAPAAVASLAALLAGALIGLSLVRDRAGLSWVLGVIAGTMTRMLSSIALGGLLLWFTRVDPVAFWMCFLVGSAGALAAETVLVTSRLKTMTP